MNGFVVAGIGTGIGKTFVATIVTEALRADYWKPVQAGELHATDADYVRQHISNGRSVIHPEAYRLTAPMSPHAAAALDGVKIEPFKLQLPASSNLLVAEPAGGIMVPLTFDFLNIHLFQQWQLPVILVSRNYLGSINHTLLSVEVLQRHNIHISGIIFNGDENPSSEELILGYTGLHCIGKIGQQNNPDREKIKNIAEQLKPALTTLL